MLRKGHILAILVISISVTTFLSISAKQDYEIPVWVKEVAGFWVADEISDQDFGEGIGFLIENDLVKIPKIKELENEIIRLKSVNDNYRGIVESLENEISKLRNENQGYDYTEPEYNEVEINPQDYCYGYADCFVGTVSKIVDGDTIEVDGQSIRFALVNAPEIGSYGGSAAKNFVESVCPVGSTVLVDEDDGQTQGSYGRMIAIVYCNDLNYILNAAVIEGGHAEIDTRFCSNSEFGSDYWALISGCGYEEPVYQPPAYEEPKYEPPKATPTPTPESSCDPSYPDVCIAPYPPDLNCGDIPYKNFKVVGSDPHGFDGDNDGIGCES
jgi:micrococcal nuclease